MKALANICNCTRELLIALLSFYLLLNLQTSIYAKNPDPCHFDYGIWSVQQPMPGCRTAMCSQLVSDKVYLFGGIDGIHDQPLLNRTVWMYDPIAGSWDTTRSPIPVGRAFFGHHTCVLRNKIYVIGGTEQCSTEPVFSRRVDIYDPATDSWESGADLPLPLGGIGVCALNGQVYVCGGMSLGCKSLESLYRYDPETDTWHREADMSTPRYRHSAVAAEGKLYVIGGINNISTTAGLKQVEGYDPGTGTWLPASAVPVQICEMAACSVDDDIYLFGGKVTLNAGILQTVIKFNPRTNSWSIVDELPGRLCHSSACAIGRSIYLFGGTGLMEPGLDRVWKYELSDVVLERNLPDLIMMQDSFSIDLSLYFKHARGGQIKYSVCSISDPTILSAWIYGSLLTLKGISEGEVSIKLLAEAGNNRAGGEISVQSVYTGLPAELTESPSFKIYPNPAADYINLMMHGSGKYLIRILAIDGRLIFHQSVNDPVYRLDISSLKRGIYYLNVKNEYFDRTEKFLKF